MKNGDNLDLVDLGDISKRSIHLNEGRIILHNLTRYPSKESIIDAVQSTPGIYVWYASLPQIDGEIEDKLALLKKMVELEDFASRETEKSITPLFDYSLKLSSHTEWPKKLEEGMHTYLRLGISDTLNQILAISILLQSPLYIGCAENLRTRITQHLNEATKFSDRIGDSTHEIMKMRLFTISIPDLELDEEASKLLDSKAIKSALETIEELFSRIYKPTFGKRYG